MLMITCTSTGTVIGEWITFDDPKSVPRNRAKRNLSALRSKANVPGKHAIALDECGIDQFPFEGDQVPPASFGGRIMAGLHHEEFRSATEINRKIDHHSGLKLVDQGQPDRHVTGCIRQKINLSDRRYRLVRHGQLSVTPGLHDGVFPALHISRPFGSGAGKCCASNDRNAKVGCEKVPHLHQSILPYPAESPQRTQLPTEVCLSGGPESTSEKGKSSLGPKNPPKRHKSSPESAPFAPNIKSPASRRTWTGVARARV